MIRLCLRCLILATALGLAGCDKCGDYFWINSGAPHSCKEGPAPQ